MMQRLHGDACKLGEIVDLVILAQSPSFHRVGSDPGSGSSIILRVRQMFAEEWQEPDAFQSGVVYRPCNFNASYWHPKCNLVWH
jgi:hypothetical protein